MAYLSHKYGATPWLTNIIYVLTAAGVYSGKNTPQV